MEKKFSTSDECDGGNRVVAITISCEPPILFANAYLPWRGSYTVDEYASTIDEISAIYAKYPQLKTIILADFNANPSDCDPLDLGKLLLESFIK